MPDKCCVPGCRGNYERNGPAVSVFHFPDDPERRKKWIQEIPRDLNGLSNPVVCERHFMNHFVIKTNSFKNENGEIVNFPRKRPMLSKLAFPSLFFVDPSRPPSASNIECERSGSTSNSNRKRKRKTSHGGICMQDRGGNIEGTAAGNASVEASTAKVSSVMLKV